MAELGSSGAESSWIHSLFVCIICRGEPGGLCRQCEGFLMEFGRFVVVTGWFWLLQVRAAPPPPTQHHRRPAEKIEDVEITLV